MQFSFPFLRRALGRPHAPAPAASASSSAAAPAPPSRLAAFLRSHQDEILHAWDEFAATVTHEGKPLDSATLRDHAAEILQTIALDLAQPQSAQEQDAKGKGLAPRPHYVTPAETHADFRMMAGFAVDAMITEYRALRASVLKIWGQQGGGLTPQDMTDLTRFNEAIDQAIAESVARYTHQTKASTDLFIGVLGHDLRNPLGTIVMSADYLVRSGQLAPGAAAPIVNATVRMRGIIEQLVDFTRAQTDGAMPILRLPGNLADQLAKVVQETQVRHPARSVRLEYSGDFAGSWDEGRIGQLLSNLLGNALLHGAREREVLVRMWAEPQQVFFSVHNDGEPISPEDCERIFRPLERGVKLGPDGQPREPTGLGLGLYICREIVRSHGGTLQVESDAASGTTFRVALPRQGPDEGGPRPAGALS